MPSYSKFIPEKMPSVCCRCKPTTLDVGFGIEAVVSKRSPLTLTLTPVTTSDTVSKLPPTNSPYKVRPRFRTRASPCIYAARFTRVESGRLTPFRRRRRPAMNAQRVDRSRKWGKATKFNTSSNFSKLRPSKTVSTSETAAGAPRTPRYRDVFS